MISTILLPIDPGTLSELVMKPAADFAKVHGASITLVAVVDSDG
jgi:nucleotide-binding universal stress UspA family protein